MCPRGHSPPRPEPLFQHFCWKVIQRDSEWQQRDPKELLKDSKWKQRDFKWLQRHSKWLIGDLKWHRDTKQLQRHRQQPHFVSISVCVYYLLLCSSHVEPFISLSPVAHCSSMNIMVCFCYSSKSSHELLSLRHQQETFLWEQFQAQFVFHASTGWHFLKAAVCISSYDYCSSGHTAPLQLCIHKEQNVNFYWQLINEMSVNIFFLLND